MKLFNAIAAATVAALSITAPAQAAPTRGEALINALTTSIEATGTRIVADAPRICKDKNTLGMYEFEDKVIDQLTLCVDNHNGDNRELLDTFLHETVHMVQTCKGGAIFTAGSILSKAHEKEIDFVAKNYSKDDFHLEMEARVIAADLNVPFVTSLINKYCFE